ncbi:MAG TPA: AmiS/UreI family transporter [Thermodesulfobacteriota bacterium]|nr:AmiS/UreI family transporter [Thermodesulfobacteriota bacterium]
MLGIGLLYVGAVLYINALVFLGKVSGRAAAIMNTFTGLLTLFIALYTAFTSPLGNASYFAAAQVLLFSFTYLWVAINNFFQVEDGSGLGWYSLFVAIIAVPTALLTFHDDFRFGFIWLAWAFLWFLFWVWLSLKRNIGKIVGYVTMIEAVLTCVLPGYLILINKW